MGAPAHDDEGVQRTRRLGTLPSRTRGERYGARFGMADCPLRHREYPSIGRARASSTRRARKLRSALPSRRCGQHVPMRSVFRDDVLRGTPHGQSISAAAAGSRGEGRPDLSPVASTSRTDGGRYGPRTPPTGARMPGTAANHGGACTTTIPAQYRVSLPLLRRQPRSLAQRKSPSPLRGGAVGADAWWSIRERVGSGRAPWERTG